MTRDGSKHEKRWIELTVLWAKRPHVPAALGHSTLKNTKKQINEELGISRRGQGLL